MKSISQNSVAVIAKAKQLDASRIRIYQAIAPDTTAKEYDQCARVEVENPIEYLEREDVKILDSRCNLLLIVITDVIDLDEVKPVPSLDEIMQESTEDLREVSITYERTGFPVNCETVLTGFKTFEEAQRLQEMYPEDTEIIQMHKRDGARVWISDTTQMRGSYDFENLMDDTHVYFGNDSEDYASFVEELGYICDDLYNIDHNNSLEWIKQEVISCLEGEVPEEIETLLRQFNAYVAAWNESSENQVILIDTDTRTPVTVESEFVEYHDWDVTSYAIALRIFK